MKRNFFLQSGHRENALNKINIVNFVDVALTLVIILLMISPMIEQGMEVRLPSSGPSKISVGKSVILTIAKNRRIFLGNQEVSIENLEPLVRSTISRNPELGIVVKGDKTITYQE
ncbi:MAG TPA: biopolymer transporter ExbD [bacterium]|nr:biopolymer transporter ExbD [bacterium]